MNTLQHSLIVGVIATVGLFSTQGHAGLVVGGTRFVLSEADHSKSIGVKNTGKEAFLVKSAVIADTGADMSGSVSDKPGNASESDMPFVITPPLFLLGGGKSSQLRVECLSCQTLPADRESLYRLGISAIPGGKPAVNSVQVAVRSTFKLFYRPAGLAGNAIQAYEQLQWKRQGSNVVVRNPTPYYVTLFEMNVNNKPVRNAGMVAPYSTRTQAWCPTAGGCDIKWQSLNDFGGISPAWSVSPTAVAMAGSAVAK
jgi:P pilus assembly chaperone PapD